MSSRDVAEHLGLSVRQVARLVPGTLIPVHRLPGVRGAMLFDPVKVEEVRAERDRAAAPTALAEGTHTSPEPHPVRITRTAGPQRAGETSADVRTGSPGEGQDQLAADSTRPSPVIDGGR